MLFSESKQVRELLSNAFDSTLQKNVASLDVGDSRDLRHKLSLICRMMPYLCGDDQDLKNVIAPMEKYCNYQLDTGYSYDYESGLLKGIFDGLQDYESIWDKQDSDMDKAIEVKYSRKGEEEDVIDPEKSGVKFITARLFLENSRMYMLRLGAFFDNFVTGTMKIPDDLDESRVYYGMGSKAVAERNAVLKMPCFAHVPVPEDINDHSIELCPGLEAFRFVAKKDYPRILGMFCDNDDGTVTIKLHKDINDATVYVRLSKLQVYLRWVLNQRTECLWSGLIVYAMAELGLDYMNMDKETFIKHCLGPDYEVEIIPDEVRDENYYRLHFSGNASLEYAKYIYEVYVSMLSTAGYNVKYQQEFGDLGMAVQMLLNSCPRVVEMPKSAMSEQIMAVKQKSEEYKAVYRGKTGKRIQARLGMCVTLDRLCDIYNSDEDSSMYPYTKVKKEFAAKVAAYIYSTMGKAPSEDELNHTIEMLLRDECYAKATQTLKIVTLCNAGSAQVAKVADKYKVLKAKNR